MTAQTIAQKSQTMVQSQPAGITARLPAVAGLLSIPGFLQLSISNGLAHSFGQRMQGIAVAWLVLEMTGSKFWLGVINGAPSLSIILFSLVGG
jgi:hypothetical protein